MLFCFSAVLCAVLLLSSVLCAWALPPRGWRFECTFSPLAPQEDYAAGPVEDVEVSRFDTSVLDQLSGSAPDRAGAACAEAPGSDRANHPFQVAFLGSKTSLNDVLDALYWGNNSFVSSRQQLNTGSIRGTDRPHGRRPRLRVLHRPELRRPPAAGRGAACRAAPPLRTSAGVQARAPSLPSLPPPRPRWAPPTPPLALHAASRASRARTTRSRRAGRWTRATPNRGSSRSRAGFPSTTSARCPAGPSSDSQRLGLEMV